MITRTNRLTREDLWGCIRFPARRETLPIEYDEKPVAKVQAMLNKETERKGLAAKSQTPFFPKPRGRKATTPPAGSHGSTDDSWAAAGRMPIEEISSDEEGRVNTNLTPEEAEMIKEIRISKKLPGTKQEPTKARRRRRPRRPIGHGQDGGDSGAVTSETSEGGPPVLSPEEVGKRIREGKARRAHLKKGLVRRIFGNVKAITAGVMLATAAYIGAATAEWMPAAGTTQPDCVEVFAGRPWLLSVSAGGVGPLWNLWTCCMEATCVNLKSGSVC